MTFANRRTGIYDLSAIDRILKDDRYVEVDGKQILPGDVILYRASNGDIEHSGVVVEVVDRLPPMIYSKWGKAGEFIHSASRSPYDFQHVKYYRIKADEE